MASAICIAMLIISFIESLRFSTCNKSVDTYAESGIT